MVFGSFTPAYILSPHDAGNVVHQEEPKTPCISEGSENGFKDFLKIPNGI